LVPGGLVVLQNLSYWFSRTEQWSFEMPESQNPSSSGKQVVRLSQKEMHQPRFRKGRGDSNNRSASIHSPGATFTTYRGKAVITDGKTEFPVRAESFIRFSPGAKAIVQVNGSEGPWGVLTGEGCFISFPLTGERYGLTLSHGHIGSDGFSAEFLFKQIDCSNVKEDLHKIRFQLMNFPDFWWKTGVSKGVQRPIRAEFGPWQLSIQETGVTQEARNQSRKNRSFLFTHAATIKRKDGQSFLASDGQQVWEFLYHILGFCAGRRCPPCVARGYNRSGAIRWRDLSLGSAHHDGNHSHWFPRPYPSGFAQLLDCAWHRWQDPGLREATERAIEWYWECVDRELIIETRLILAQVAAELLSWVVMVDEGSRISANGFKPLPASDKIALLANQMSSSIAIPDSFTELARVAKSQNWSSTPQAFVELRNKIIHAEKKGRSLITGLEWQAKHQAAEWGVWLVELGILWLLGYQHRYDSRVAKPQAGFPYVPWVDPSQAGAPGAAKA
jgi:hypothetical protein